MADEVIKNLEVIAGNSENQLVQQEKTTEAVKELEPALEGILAKVDRIAKNTEDKGIQKVEIVSKEDGEDEDWNENEAGKTLWKMLRGPKGHTPVKGKEYYTEEERKNLITEILKEATPEKGIDYYTDEELQKIADEIFERVRKPEDGKTPVKGVDYFDGEPGDDADEEAIEGRITEKLLAKIPTLEQIVEKIPPPEKGDPGSPDTGTDIVNKLESLPEEERLDYDKLRNTPNIQALVRKLAGDMAKPSKTSAQSYAISDMTDVSMQGIVAGQLLQWDGRRFIPYTPVSVSGVNQIFNEVPSGSGTSFTIANTPISGTLRLFRGGGRLTEGTDYSSSGVNITLGVSLSVGEDFVADYNY